MEEEYCARPAVLLAWRAQQLTPFRSPQPPAARTYPLDSPHPTWRDRSSTPTPRAPCPPWPRRYDTRRDLQLPADAPVIGLVLQRSHLVTGDEGHYSGVVSELEARGARVVPIFAGAQAADRVVGWARAAAAAGWSAGGALHPPVLRFKDGWRQALAALLVSSLPPHSP